MIAGKPDCMDAAYLRRRATALQHIGRRVHEVDTFELDLSIAALNELAALIEAGVDVAPDADSQERAA